MTTIRLTMAQALVRFLCAQRSEVDGSELPLFAGVFAIFGHGNVAGLGEALYAVTDRLPTLRAHNEQAMALAAIGFAKASRRRRMMACTSSIGPGATNMVTAAAVAHANRLPVLLLPGDIFASRGPDPVLQQIEAFGDPTISVNDCFRPVSRWWDRITRPEQILASLPQAMRVLTDPAECGPVTLALPQDVQAEAYDYPEAFFQPRCWRMRRPAAGPGGARRGRGGTGTRASAADHRRRRGALRIGLRRARRVRRAASHTGGRDPGRQGRARLGSPPRGRRYRRHRQCRGQCARRRGGCRACHRHAPF